MHKSLIWGRVDLNFHGESGILFSYCLIPDSALADPLKYILAHIIKSPQYSFASEIFPKTLSKP